MADSATNPNETLCPECFHPLIFSNLDQICSYCGLVINEEINLVSPTKYLDDHYPSRRTYDRTYNPTYRLSDCKTPESLSKFSRLKRREFFTLQKGMKTYYSSFLSHMVSFFNASSQMETDTLYLYQKILRVYQIPSNQKIHISLLVTCFYCVSSWRKHRMYVSLKKLLDFCHAKGHRMKLRFIANLMKEFPLLMDNYRPLSIRERVDFFQREVITTYLGHTNVKEEFPRHFLTLSFDDYSEQLSNRYHIILKEINPHLSVRSRNPLRLCCGVLYLSNLNVTKDNNVSRFLTQEKIGVVLNVPSTYIRDGVVEVREILNQ